VAELIAPERLEQIVQRTRDGGAEIVSLLKTGSAYYAPGAAVVQMIDAILLDTRQILPCSVHLHGEYGVTGVFSGVPARLGSGGLVEVVEMDLSGDDQAALHRSAAAVEEIVGVIEANRPQIDPLLPSLFHHSED
jgi:malate dehydrogenase